MPTRGKRNRNRNRGARAEAPQEQPVTQQDSSGSRQRNRRRSRRARSQQQGNSPIALLAIGVGVAMVVVIGFAFFQVSRGAGSVGDFEFSVYQGQEELGGSNIDFSDLIDRAEPIVLNFWAGDCPPCQEEMPALQRVYDKHNAEITFVGLDVGVFTGLGTRQSALDLLEQLNITYPTGAPPGRTPMTNYSVVSMPTTIFIGADGNIFQRWDGGISERQMNDIVEAMIEQTAG